MSRLLAIALCLNLLVLTGCQLWPFHRHPVRTSYITPTKRIAAIEEIGQRAMGADARQQEAAANELARQLQTEPDPLVRESIMKTVAPLQAPMAERILVAGLKDEDSYVRQACCRLLGKRRDPGIVEALKNTLQNDEDMDVRLAATKALGALGTKEAIPAIAIALNDSDHALQYMGMQAMQVASGERLGNDVATWQAFARRYQAAQKAAPALAEQQDSQPTF